ncbi:MAG: hypothetical protein B6D41_10640 [Chloroflexi bacterium UTCFX4]|nr:MAG: hypothetical protein B6D41_10640 [Chloroflexi bacterium UTCFX4]
MTIENVAPADAAPPWRRVSNACVIGGSILAAAGLCAGGVFLIVPFALQADTLAANTAVLSVASILLIYGALLVWVGRALHKNRLRAPFQLPAPSIFLGALFLTLAIGQTILFINILPALWFPVWHVLASLLFPLAVLSFSARRLDATSTRSVLAQFTWGGLVTIGLALIFELIVGGFLMLLAALGIAVILGQDALDNFIQTFTRAPTDMEQLVEIILQQPLAASIAGGAALLLIILLVPLLEELLKSIGVAPLLRGRARQAFLPTRGNAVLWGLAAGAGFAFSENLLNGQGALNNPNAQTGVWASAMILRAGTSLMHMVMTATVAVGWHEALVARHPIRLPLLLLAAVLAHAIWNTVALLQGSVSATRTADTALASASTVLSVLTLALLALLFIGYIYWLRSLLQWARRSAASIST